MPTVRVPNRYFQSKLNDYADWRIALARELLQNSKDAGARRVDVTFGMSDDHQVAQMTFTDDGPGMDRTILEDVYFQLGETTKHTTDTVGGFGQARMITCFAQTAYQIRTQDVLVTGSGAQYDIETCDEYFDGCKLIIDLVDETADRVREAMQVLLGRCALQFPVTIDGEQVEPRPMPSRARRILEDDNGRPWAKVYVEKDAFWPRMHVRSSGLAMYSRSIPGRDTIVVELTPSRSREVLANSRDRLKPPHAEQLDGFVHELSTNRRRALRPEHTPLDVHVTGGGFVLSVAKPSDDGQEDEAHSDDRNGGRAAAGTLSSGPDRRQRPAGPTTVGVRPADAHAAAALASAPTVGTEPGRLGIPKSDLDFDVFMFADAQTSRVLKLARLWDPSGWDASKGRQRRALLLAWKAAVGYAIERLQHLAPKVTEVTWAVGWTFDKDVEAIAQKMSAGTVFALNPVGDDDRTRYQLSDRESRRWLLARAVHEVTHVVADGHDEQYAGALTDLFASVDPNEADRRIRAAAKAA